MCTQVHAALFTVARKQPQCPAMAGWLDKQTAVTGCDSALKRKAILTPASAWTNLENIVLSERSQAQKDKDCMFHTREVPRGSDSQRQRVGARARGAGRMGS